MHPASECNNCEPKTVASHQHEVMPTVAEQQLLRYSQIPRQFHNTETSGKIHRVASFSHQVCKHVCSSRDFIALTHCARSQIFTASTKGFAFAQHVCQPPGMLMYSRCGPVTIQRQVNQQHSRLPTKRVAIVVFLRLELLGREVFISLYFLFEDLFWWRIVLPANSHCTQLQRKIACSCQTVLSLNYWDN